MARRLVYPEPLAANLPTVSVGSELELIHQYGSALPIGHQIPLLFDSPVRLVVRVSSVIGEERQWLRAGYLAQVLYGLPGDPKRTVNRLYLDERFFEFDGAGYPFYFEFWPYRWLSDYFLEVWAASANSLPVEPSSELLTIDGEPFTINGVPLSF